jgi:hypothetical protein
MRMSHTSNAVPAPIQASSGGEPLVESCGQVAVQASGALRNLAVPPQVGGARGGSGGGWLVKVEGHRVNGQQCMVKGG